tara:strand:+ start:4444 stop:4842 length:399 start_codon:yes stop_codon:yes gene_type:complete
MQEKRVEELKKIHERTLYEILYYSGPDKVLRELKEKIWKLEEEIIQQPSKLLQNQKKIKSMVEYQFNLKKQQDIKNAQNQIIQLQQRIKQLERENIDNIPLDKAICNVCSHEYCNTPYGTAGSSCTRCKFNS